MACPIFFRNSCDRLPYIRAENTVMIVNRSSTISCWDAIPIAEPGQPVRVFDQHPGDCPVFGQLQQGRQLFQVLAHPRRLFGKHLDHIVPAFFRVPLQPFLLPLEIAVHNKEKQRNRL